MVKKENKKAAQIDCIVSKLSTLERILTQKDYKNTYSALKKYIKLKVKLNKD